MHTAMVSHKKKLADTPFIFCLYRKQISWNSRKLPHFAPDFMPSSHESSHGIAIARAIYSESPILLLDEAASALNSDTEKMLLQNLRSMTDKTGVIVTHRPAALEICDRVIDFTNIAE